MLKYLLDTNIAIYTQKNRPQQVKRRFQQHHGRMGISAVTLDQLSGHFPLTLRQRNPRGTLVEYLQLLYPVP